MLAHHTHNDLQLPCSASMLPIHPKTNSSTAYPEHTAQTSTCCGSTKEGGAALLQRCIRARELQLTSNNRPTSQMRMLLGQNSPEKIGITSKFLRHPGQIRRDLLVQETVVTQNVDHLISDTCFLLTSPAITNRRWSTCRTGGIAPH